MPEVFISFVKADRLALSFPPDAACKTNDISRKDAAGARRYRDRFALV